MRAPRVVVVASLFGVWIAFSRFAPSDVPYIVPRSLLGMGTGAPVFRDLEIDPPSRIVKTLPIERRTDGGRIISDAPRKHYSNTWRMGSEKIYPPTRGYAPPSNQASRFLMALLLNFCSLPPSLPSLSFSSPSLSALLFLPSLPPSFPHSLTPSLFSLTRGMCASRRRMRMHGHHKKVRERIHARS